MQDLALRFIDLLKSEYATQTTRQFCRALRRWWAITRRFLLYSLSSIRETWRFARLARIISLQGTISAAKLVRIVEGFACANDNIKASFGRLRHDALHQHSIEHVDQLLRPRCKCVLCVRLALLRATNACRHTVLHSAPRVCSTSANDRKPCTTVSASDSHDTPEPIKKRKRQHADECFAEIAAGM